MRLLILGGTRYLSRTVATQAVERGHDVTVAARGESGEPPAGTRFVKIDRSTVEGLAPLAGERFDAVIDVARLPAYVKNAIEVLGDNVGHYGFVSTISVYTDEVTTGQTVATAPVHEATAEDCDDADMALYGPNKVACENLVHAAYPDNHAIYRAGLIVGPADPGDRFGYWPWRIAQGGEILAPGAPEDTVQWIDVEDLASWTLDATETGTVGTYDGLCPPVTWERFLGDMIAALDVDATLTWVPAEILAEQKVNPWMGENSLPLWIPQPEYAGAMSRDVTTSVEAGLRNRSAGDSARRWHEWSDGSPAVRAGISRAKEAEVLAAWYARA